MEPISSHLSSLNPSQLEAVQYRGGHVLIVAGPGTGKTHTITHRIATLIPELKRDEKILAITFTKKAAEEMRSRLTRLLSGKTQPLFVGTFHQFCLNVLQEYDPLTHYEVGDPKDILSWVKECWPEQPGRFYKDLLYSISLAKSDVLKKEKSEEFLEYQELLDHHGVIDFDDVLLKCYEFLYDNEEIRENVQQKFSHIFIDEYQDINAIQHALIKIIVGQEQTVTAIGDPNQAIYGFRGSDVRFFKSFDIDFTDVKLLTLSDNYRSSENLLSASSQVIAKNQTLHVPELTAKLYTQGRLSIYEARTEKAEAEYVAHQIEKMIGGVSMFSQDSGRVQSFEEAQISFGDIVILYRINSQRFALQGALERLGVPYSVSVQNEEEEDEVCPGQPENLTVDSEKVALMTLHASKGLEFPVVFIVGCEEKLLPLDLQGMTSNIEEERRLFYVGMTRAKQWLYLLRSRRRSFFGKTWETLPSPFLSDIEEDLKAYEVNVLKSKRKKPKDQQMQLFS